MMLLVDEPGTRRLFVNDMRGPLYSVSYDGKTRHAVPRHQRAEVGRQRAVAGQRARLPELRVPPAVQPAGRAGLRQVLHLHRHQQHDAGAGLHAAAAATQTTHDTVLLEWTAKTPAAATYDGGPPRELMRLRQPFANHNARAAGLQPARRGRARRLRPAVHGRRRRRQRRRSAAAGAEPRHRRSARSSASIRSAPTAPTASTAFPPAIRSSGQRPARSARSTPTACATRSASRGTRRNGKLFLADIGQNIVEEVSLVTAGANLGWNDWEGSYRFISREAVNLTSRAAIRRSRIRSSNTASSIRCCSRSRR